MRRIALLLPDRFFAGGVAGTVDLLHIANRLAGGQPLFAWQLLSADGAPATAANGLAFAADGRYGDAGDADAIVVPGITYPDLAGFERRIAGEHELLARLSEWHADGRLIAGNCTGVALLAESGILDGRPATISWWLSGWFRQRYPKVALETHAILTESGQLLSSGATTCYLNLGLRLIERLGGKDVALSVARLMLVDTHRASQAPYATLQQYAGHNDPLVSRAQDWLQARLAEPFSLAALAAAAGASERTLMRRFRQALGDTPLHYLQQMRLFAARRLLEDSALALEQIVARVGYEDVSTFRRLFKRELGCSPGEYRRRFAARAA
ncbi:GlxA family transcriptional regulator [Azospira restricta]|uniref:Helix-turn-helix domain-containing protein n=1 Tax=Azospira restricta TaxID=404405 RepID=A0A974SS57_9RHOO|nr:helix-turn-helix domain-containing protein [Azospira restricta]QRJ65387.1 helix-turn-helix domain-containing protein [Azospira restricta]